MLPMNEPRQTRAARSPGDGERFVGADRGSGAGGENKGGTHEGGADTARAEQVLRQFRVIFRSVKKHFQVIEKQCGIGGSQLWALAAIGARPGIRVTELARTLSIHQSTASNLIEQMSRLGLVRRERDMVDQRVVRLHATDLGAALLARAPLPLTGVLPDALGQLDATELDALHASLGRLLQVMRVRDESAEHTPLADL